MAQNTFDNVTRAAAGSLPRRRTLATLLAGCVTALGMPPATQARKKRKRGKKKGKGKGKNLCPRQQTQWEEFLLASCQPGEDPTACGIGTLLPCGEPLATCDADGFFDCIVEAVTS